MFWKSKVKEVRLPQQSALWALHRQKNDFVDCFAGASPLEARQAAEIAFDSPWWVRALLLVRRLITAPFGLDNSGPKVPNKIGLFPVISQNKDELILGFDDTHLDFRICVLKQEDRVYLGTWVHPHHFGGKLYLALIMPFHKLVVRDAVGRVCGATQV